MSCHSRWCERLVPEFSANSTSCANVRSTLKVIGVISEVIPLTSCCKLYCKQQGLLPQQSYNNLLPLQCQGASIPIAAGIWVSVVASMFFATLYILSVSLQRGGGWVAKLGGVTFGTAIALVAIIFGDGYAIDTKLYPIIGTMFLTTFAYFFCGFQYSVNINYEAAPIVLIVGTGYPLFYQLRFPSFDMDLEAAYSSFLIGLFGVIMVILSLLWILHSAFHRTIVYRAVWNRAWRQQSQCSNSQPTVTSPEGDTTPLSPPHPPAITTSSDVELGACTLPLPVVSTGARQYNMRNLWVLAAGQGHPTWRTTVGQGTAVYLIVLNCLCIWQARKYLSDASCTDDFILFQMMLYSPPILLTLSLISVQISFFRFGWKDMHGPEKPSGFSSNLKKVISSTISPVDDPREPSLDYAESTFVYRTGRNCLAVKYRAERVKKTKRDILCGLLVGIVEYGLYVLNIIPAVVISSIMFIILYLIASMFSSLKRKVSHELSKVVHFTLRREARHGQGKWSHDWHATQLLINCCQKESLGIREEPSVSKKELQLPIDEKDMTYSLSKDLVSAALNEDKSLIKQVHKIFNKYGRCVNLHLLLDKLGPSELIFLLKRLDMVLPKKGDEKRDKIKKKEDTEATTQGSHPDSFETELGSSVSNKLLPVNNDVATKDKRKLHFGSSVSNKPVSMNNGAVDNEQKFQFDM